MKKSLAICFAFISVVASAQSKTTNDLDDKYEGLSLYFYKNTLKMLNQTDNKEFDELVKDVEKMKFLMIDKVKGAFTTNDFKKLVKDYQGEKYDEVITSRYKGKSLNMYIKQENNKVKGTVILVNDSSSLYVLDILGKVALDKASALFKTIDENTDIGKRIKDFTGGDDKSKKKRKEHGIVVD